MPPKVKTTKEDIINAATDIVRQSGAQAINARNIAAKLNCSTQPVFSNFETMEQLHLAVREKAEELAMEYISREIAEGKYPEYKASGMAYIRFAKEEKELFRLLYMCDRKGEPVDEDTEIMAQMENLVQENTGMSGVDARLFHLEIWACVHGIATMFATGYLDLDWELVSRIISDCYFGLKKRYNLE